MDKILPSGEREYIRMKVGDVLMVCMEDSSVIPIQKLVESLVMVGPESSGYYARNSLGNYLTPGSSKK